MIFSRIRRLPVMFVAFLLVTSTLLGAFPQLALLQDSTPEATPEATPERQTGLLLNSDGATDGYTLYTPLLGHTVYVLDKTGQVVRSLTFDNALTSEPYLLKNGDLLFTTFVATKTIDNPFVFGGAGGQIEEHSPDGKLVWSFQFADEVNQQHHDIKLMPNGHILMLAWETHTSDVATAAGAKPDILPTSGKVMFEEVVELDPAAQKIVWQWHLLDHLIQDYDPKLPNYGKPSDHPERIDINFPQKPASGDWYHDNSIDYNPTLDQILISCRSLSEIWIIDHSTTTAEAAGSTGGKSGKGGDLLYRWGNPLVYQAGAAADEQLYFQHDAEWIQPGLPGAGDISIMNNGVLGGQPDYSKAVEIVPPLNTSGSYDLNGVTYGPDKPTWEYSGTPLESFYTPFIGSVQRLSNGNTFIDEGTAGRFLEVTSAGQIVWEYANDFTGDLPPSGVFQPYSVFRARHYALDDTGMMIFLGK